MTTSKPADQGMGVGSLPGGWSWATIGEISTQVNSGFPCGKHNTEGKGVPHLRPMNISPNGEVDLSFVKYVEASGYDALQEGDVLFNNTNSPDWLGKTTWIKKPTEWAYSNHMTRVRLHLGLHSGWVASALHYLFLTGFFRMNCRHHVNQASINTTFLSNQTSIPSPPFPEQRRIVGAIETQFTRLNAAVAALERAKANLQRYKASVLKAACEGRLVPTEDELARREGRDYEPADELLQRILAERSARWEDEQWAKEVERAKRKAAQAKRRAAGLPARIRDLRDAEWQDLPEAEYAPYLPKNDRWKRKCVEPETSDTEGLANLPEGWCWASLGQLIDRIDAGRSPKAQTRPALGNEFGVLKVSAVSWERFLPEENKALLPGDVPKPGSTVRKGDLLISRANTVELVGAVVLVERDYPNLMLSDKTLRLVPTSPEVSSRYSLYALRIPVVRRFFARNATGTSDSMRNLSQAKFRATPIPFPSATEQARIVEDIERRLSLVTALESAINTNLARADRLRQAILKRAFEGRLVPQDPSDEPASVLLERIGVLRGENWAEPRKVNTLKQKPPRSGMPKQLTLL